MKRKSLFSIEILSYILQFVFTLFAGYFLYLLITDSIELFDVLFTKYSDLYNYGSLKEEKHAFLAFLYDHQYSIYGGNATRINDGVPLKKSLIIYNLFGITQNFILFVICCIAVIFFHNVSEKKVYDGKNSKKLLIIALLLVLVPIIEIIGDQIVVAITTKAINSKITSTTNHQYPGKKFLGINYNFILASLFTLSTFFSLKHAECKLEYNDKN